MTVIHVARKPISAPTIVENVVLISTGALNIDGCKIPTADGRPHYAYAKGPGGHGFHGGVGDDARRKTPSTAVKGTRVGVADVASDLGRWPANIILDCEVPGLETFFKRV